MKKPFTPPLGFLATMALFCLLLTGCPSETSTPESPSASPTELLMEDLRGTPQAVTNHEKGDSNSHLKAGMELPFIKSR